MSIVSVEIIIYSCDIETGQETVSTVAVEITIYTHGILKLARKQ